MLIWAHSLRGPCRHAPVLIVKEKDTRIGDDEPGHPPPSQCRSPELLQVNHESRAFALQNLERRAHYKSKYGPYVNFELDEFFFRGAELLDLYDLSRIQGADVESLFNISLADRSRMLNLILGFSWTTSSPSARFSFGKTLCDALRKCLLAFDGLKDITIEIWQDDALARIPWNNTTNPKPEISEGLIDRLRSYFVWVFIEVSLIKTNTQMDWERPRLKLQVERATNRRIHIMEPGSMVFKAYTVGLESYLKSPQTLV